jgi:Ca-activated chloride channel homolog
MLYLRLAKFLSSILVIIAAALCAPQVVLAHSGDDGIRADLPLSGILFVENGRGNVHIEVWQEQYVSVLSTVRGEKPKVVPVSVIRTDDSLKIIVSSQQVGMLTRVDLTLRIPERAHAQITATRGDIEITGAPAELSAETVSGNIRASFSQSSDVKVTADAATGNTSFENCAPSSGREDIYRICRMGAGDRPVSLRSERGHIYVTSPDARESNPTMSETRKTPVLLGTEKNKAGAGTPSVPLTSPEEVGDDDVVRVDTELVTLNVSVIDRSTNRGLQGLKEGDFKLFEDGRQQELAHFESANAPFNLILLIDLSTSTQEKIGLVREAALRFVNATRPADRIGIITFANTPVIASPLTSDRAVLRDRINAIEQPKGSTKLYDALDFAMNEVLKGSKDSRRNAIVLMSDGLDSILPNVDGDGSALDYNELLSRVREFDGVLYTLWLDTTYEPLSALDIQDETFDLAYDRMKELAEAGGGTFYEVDKLEDLADAYERVVADLGTVYSLSYRPTNRERNGKWRAIRVAVAQPNAVARGKRGYYAN